MTFRRGQTCCQGQKGSDLGPPVESPQCVHFRLIHLNPPTTSYFARKSNFPIEGDNKLACNTLAAPLKKTRTLAARGGSLEPHSMKHTPSKTFRWLFNIFGSKPCPMSPQENPARDICGRCGLKTPSEESRPVARGFRWIAGLSLGAVHAGWWIWEELSQPYCRRCRRWLSFLCVVLGGLVLSLALLALRWALRHGLLPFLR